MTTYDTGAPPVPSENRRLPAAEGDTTRRTYAEVLGVFAAFFAVGVVAAILDLAGRYSEAAADASWAQYGPAALEDVARTGLAVTVVVLLAGRRGLSRHDLGLAWRRNDRGRVRVFAEMRVAAIALLAFIAGGVLTAVTHGHSLPLRGPTAANLVYECAHSFEAGVMEEVVVLGFVVAMLRRAGRPTREILALAVLLRMSYHIYYGPGVVGIAVWAAIFVWLFWRTRSLLPLIVVHVWWDTVLSLDQRWHAVGGFGGLVTFAFLVAAGISWLVERGHKPTPTASPAPPGWYPDPADGHQLRWWDGATWHPTATVRPHSPAGVPASWTLQE